MTTSLCGGQMSQTVEQTITVFSLTFIIATLTVIVFGMDRALGITEEYVKN